MLTNPEEEEGVTASLEADRHCSSVLVALSRRSGRIPALPCLPIKPLHCRAVAENHQRKTIHSGRKQR